MADRVSASIVLGGTIAPPAFAELLRLIESESLSTDWDGAPFQLSDIALDEPLHLCAHEVAWGQFDDLENWCIEHAVPFCRKSGAFGGEWNAERVVFTGVGAPRSFAADADDHIVISEDIVEKLGSMAAIRLHFEAARFAIPPLVVEGG